MNEAETRAEYIDPALKAAGWGVAEGEKTHRSVDLLGRVYEYFLTRFASAEGKNGGQFYTPSCVVRCLVEPVPVRKDLAPYKGRIYDPACGSGGMFVQSEKFVGSHGGTAMRDSAKPISEASPRELRQSKHHRGDNSWPSARTYGQESNATTRRLAIMNLAIRGIEADNGKEHADTFRHVQHPDLRADTATRSSAKPKPRSHSAGLLRSERQLLANPPFNDSDWFRKDDDVRWQFGVPPKGNANFAWVQHFIHHLAPQGMAGFVLANGSMSSNQSGDRNARSACHDWATDWQGLGSQRDIRLALVEADLVDRMVALPGQLFYSTQIPVCLWFWGKNYALDSANDNRLFDGETELSLVA